MNFTAEKRAAIAKQDAKAYKWGCCCALPLFLVLLPVFIIGYLVRQDPLDEQQGYLGATLPDTEEEMQEKHYQNRKYYFLTHQADFETLRKQVQAETKQSAYATFTPENNILVSKLGLLQASLVGVGQSKRVILKAYDEDRRLGYYSYVYSEAELPSSEAVYRQLKGHWFMNQSYESKLTTIPFR